MCLCRLGGQARECGASSAGEIRAVRARRPPRRSAVRVPGRRSSASRSEAMPAAARTGALDHAARQSADRAGDRQSRLAASLRPGHRARRRRTSASGASRRPIPNCSTGWRPGSSPAAGRSRTCTGRSSPRGPTSSPATTTIRTRRSTRAIALLWRFSRRRLDAESIRDAMLAVSGRLDRRRPEPHPFPPIEQWRWTQHNAFKAVYPTERRIVFT